MPDSPIATTAPASPTPAVSQDNTNTNAPAVAAPFNDAFSDLDKMVGVPEPTASNSPAAKDAARKSARPAEAPKAAEPERPGTDPLEKPADIEIPADDKPADVPKADTTKPVETPKTGDKPKMGPWQQLREAQAKLKELESKQAGKVDEAATKAAEEKLAKLESDLAEKEKAIQLADYTQSEDYAKNFLKPFTEAYAESREAVAQFQVTDPETGEVRQATGADFDTLMRINDPNKAAEMIDTMFGTGSKAAEVAAMRREILKLNTRRTAQIEAKKSEAATVRQTTAAERAKSQQEAAKAYSETVEKLITDRKEFFAPDDDAKGNEILAKSRVIADMAFGKLPEGRAPLTPVEAAKLHAVMHAKASGFDRLAYRNQMAQTRIKALEAELAEFKASEPGKGEGKAGSKAPVKSMSAYEAAEAALEEMAR